MFSLKSVTAAVKIKGSEREYEASLLYNERGLLFYAFIVNNLSSLFWDGGLK